MPISQIIMSERENDVFVWKHPETDFTTTSQLIVHESQEAILFRNGQALDLFGAGRYTLKTENIPFLRKIINIPTGGETPFHCEVYFINKVDCMDILWGTASPILIKDPIYDIILPVRANGQFAVRVDDSRKFIVKLVGTTSELGKDTLIKYFRGLLMTRIKDYISKLMMERKISFLDVHSHLNEISEDIKSQISNAFKEYGVNIINFFINSITIPTDDPGYIKIRNALAAAKERELLAKGKKAEMDIIGYNYQQDRSFDILEKAAQNEGTSGNVMGLGMGLGMGVPMGGAVGEVMGNVMQNVSQNTNPSSKETIVCSKCKEKLPANSKFCMSCGTKVEVVDINNIICPNCSEKVPKGKFCINCGFVLERKCPKCGAELSPNAKFCMQCGEKL